MKTKRAFFVGMILVGSLISLGIMNINYDRLSRYPYQNEENNRLIKNFLTDEEIEYIIEYAIAPAMFIAYIQEDGFNIYHASEYRELNRLVWNETPSSVVKMVETTRHAMDSITLANYLIHYDFDEIHYWIDHGDPYNEEAVLVTNAGNPNALLDDNHTVSIRKPFNLQQINNNVVSREDSKILIDIALQMPLQELCAAISMDLDTNRACGGLIVNEGYISYTEQEKRYKEAQNTSVDNADKIEFKPGHSEHQLGLAVDFMCEGLSDENFIKTEQYKWLNEHAHQFGLIQTYKATNSSITNKSEQTYHFRYVGYELARYLYEHDLSLSDIIAN